MTSRSRPPGGARVRSPERVGGPHRAELSDVASGRPWRPATARQLDVLAAYVACSGSISHAADLVGIRPSTAKRHLADLRAKWGLSTEQLIYVGRAAGWLVVLSLESL
jgi:hypothetical protein